MAAGQEVKAREVSGSAPDIPNDRKEAIEERKHLHCVVEHQSRQHDDYEVADVSGEHWQICGQPDVERRVQGDAEIALAAEEQDDESADVDEASFGRVFAAFVDEKHEGNYEL